LLQDWLLHTVAELEAVPQPEALPVVMTVTCAEATAAAQEGSFLKGAQAQQNLPAHQRVRRWRRVRVCLGIPACEEIANMHGDTVKQQLLGY